MADQRNMAAKQTDPDSPSPIRAAWKSFMRTPRQHKIIWTGIVCLGLLVLYVPWDGDHGYGLIFAPPQHARRIDLPRVLLPMAFVLCATIAGAFLTRDKG